MSTRSSRAKSKQRKGGRPSSRRGPDSGAPDLIRDVSTALAEDHPLMLLELVSTLLAALEPRRYSPFERGPEPDGPPSRAELVQSFLEVDLPETSALLAVIGGFSGDEMLRRRIHREITRRAHALPRWLADLHRAQPDPRAVEVAHVLRDGDNILVGVRLPGGAELTAVVYVDHNMGTLVKDAFVVPEAVDDLVERMLTVADDPDTTARDISSADARARITEAIELGAITFPPMESETWPSCRPLAKWITAMLPAGGIGHQRPEWDDAAVAALTERFLDSPSGAGFDDDDGRSLLESLLWFGTDYGFGDPLLWSPVAVEILLVDWIPRKIVADVPFLARAPAVLRAFIRFAHQERAIRPGLTTRTLEAVDEYEPQYQRLIRSPRPQGPAALLAAMGAADDVDAPWALPDDPADDEPVELSEIMLDSLRRAVGGEDVLDGLDSEPLPDEAFAWEPIPADVHDRVGEVLGLVDGCCDELLDVEYRTACRRFLSRAAAGDPAIFRRRGRAATAAAALCWVIGKANKLFDADAEPHVLAKDLVGHFAIGQPSVSQRSEPFLRAIGVDPRRQYGGMYLGSPDYLTATRRAQIIALRDHYRAMDA